MLWIISLYVLQGFYYAFVVITSLIMFKSLNMSNQSAVFYTSFFAIPWFLKPLFSPLMERVFYQKKVLLSLSGSFVFLILCLILALKSASFFFVSCILFVAMACLGSMFDTLSDGFYITHLDRKNQSKYIGLQSMSYQFGQLCAKGGLTLLVGWFLKQHSLDMHAAWQFAFSVTVVFVFLLMIVIWKLLPLKIYYSPQLNFSLSNFKSVGQTLLSLPNLIPTLFFLLIYNFSEAQLLKITPLFFMDDTMQGGLGLKLASVGVLTGVVGVVAVIAGVSLSGWLLQERSVKRYLVPITMMVSAANLGYIYLTYFSASLWLIGSIVFMTQFTFGLSNGVYMVSLFRYFSQRHYAMSLYSIGTAMMTFSMIAGGMMSGYLQMVLGYRLFFYWIVACGGLIILYCFYFLKKSSHLE